MMDIDAIYSNGYWLGLLTGIGVTVAACGIKCVLKYGI